MHRSVFYNSMLSTTILSMAFFLFISIGLFKGIKLKDDLGKLTDKIQPSKFPDLTNSSFGGEFIHAGEGIGGILLSIVLWLLVSILLTGFIWLFGLVMWTLILVVMAMLYWVFFRALRLVFKSSNQCRGNFAKSVYLGLSYTLLYNSWIYIVAFISHHLM